MSKKQKTLQPCYAKNFRCIGGKCEHTCCSVSWNILVDKDIYNLYKKCPDARLRQKLDKNITRNRANPSNRNYAKIKFSIDNSYCPFFDEEHLCSIQRIMGEKYLSITCMIYPRHYNIINGIQEKSLYLSCPEAARLALLNNGLMEFEMIAEESHITTHKYVDKILDIADAKKRGNPEQYFPELRVFVISLLQNRLYPLWQRMIILGLFCNNLNNLFSKRKANKILHLITTYLEHLKSGVFHDYLENIPDKLSVQITILKELTANRAISRKNSSFAKCFAEAMEGINYSAELSNEELADNYNLAYKNYYQPLMGNHEYILENYLVNYVFMTLFPLGKAKSVFGNYMIFVAQYAMVKSLLTGIAGYHKEKFDIGHVIKLIYSFTTTCTHDPLYLESIVDCLKSNKMDNMPYMSILIKN